jgi:ABC-2 type transport system ATP-binding protein
VIFERTPPGWEEQLRKLPEVESVDGRENVFRIATRNGPATTMALLDAAAQIQLPVRSLSVQTTTLDDVFVHYTGRQLRDALQEASPQDSSFMMRR